MTYRDNEVKFSLPGTKYNLLDGTFTIKDFCVSSGEDPKGHIYNGLSTTCGADGKMSWSIGRSGRKKTADWFNSVVSSNNTTFNHSAGELNFAFLGTLTLKIAEGYGEKREASYTFDDIVLAQGHTGLSNNWWFGGKQCNYIGEHRVETEGKINNSGLTARFKFFRGGNNVNQINIIPAFVTAE